MLLCLNNNQISVLLLSVGIGSRDARERWAVLKRKEDEPFPLQ